MLNYVAPEARFTGVSKALLAEMESKAQSIGLPHCTVESTMTAERFYRSAGYSESRPSRKAVEADPSSHCVPPISKRKTLLGQSRP